MIRIAISLAAYEAIAASLPKGHEVRPPERVKLGKGVGVWLDPGTVAALRMARGAGEGWSEVILRLCSEAALVKVAAKDASDAETTRKPVEVAARARQRSDQRSGQRLTGRATKRTASGATKRGI
jgi:hypothetical protein